MTVIGLPDGEADRLARLALTEDLSLGADVTTVATVAEDATDVGEIVARADGVLCGLDIARAVFAAVDPDLDFRTRVHDGDRVRRGDLIATVSGSTRSILTGERSALNLLCMLSGSRRSRRAGSRRSPAPAPAPSSATPARPCRDYEQRRSMPSAAAVGRTTAWGWATRR